MTMTMMTTTMMMTRRNSSFVILLAFLLLPIACAHASSNDAKKPYALIFGTVYGPDDRPVYGVNIQIRRADQKKAKWELMSDHAGEFAQRLPAGAADYIISTDPKHPAPEVKVHIENDERKDISVHLQ
jgi:hypothetical protein